MVLALEMAHGGHFIGSEIHIIRFPLHKELGIGAIDLFQTDSKEGMRAELAEELDEIVAARYLREHGTADDQALSDRVVTALRDPKYREWRKTNDWAARVAAARERFLAHVMPKRSIYTKDRTQNIFRDVALWVLVNIDGRSIENIAGAAQRGEPVLPGGPYRVGEMRGVPETPRGIRFAVRRAEELLSG